MAVFGSMHMGASRLVNLQRHRIAQCRSIVIRILGDEGVPVQGTSINHVDKFLGILLSSSLREHFY